MRGRGSGARGCRATNQGSDRCRAAHRAGVDVAIRHGRDDHVARESRYQREGGAALQLAPWGERLQVDSDLPGLGLNRVRCLEELRPGQAAGDGDPHPDLADGHVAPVLHDEAEVDGLAELGFQGLALEIQRQDVPRVT